MSNQMHSPFIVSLNPEGFSQDNSFLLNHESCRAAAQHARKLQQFNTGQLNSPNLVKLIKGLAQQSGIWTGDIFPNVVNLADNICKFSQHIEQHLKEIQTSIKTMGPKPEKGVEYHALIGSLRYLLSRSSYAMHNIIAVSKRVNSYLYVANSEVNKLLEYKKELAPFGLEEELGNIRKLNTIPMILQDFQVAWKRIYDNVEELIERLKLHAEKQIPFHIEINVERTIEDWKILAKQAEEYQKQALITK